MRWCGLLNYHIGRLQSLRAFFHVKSHLLTFGQSLEAVAGNSTEMNEHIVTAVVLRDEAETLGFIEPLNSTCSYYFYLKLKLTICRLHVVNREFSRKTSEG